MPNGNEARFQQEIIDARGASRFVSRFSAQEVCN